MLSQRTSGIEAPLHRSRLLTIPRIGCRPPPAAHAFSGGHVEDNHAQKPHRRARARALARFRSAAAQTSAPPLKVGFVYVSPVGQAGWTYQHDQGAAGARKRARRQGQDHRRRSGARGRRRRARDARPRVARPQPDLRHQLRLPRAGAARRGRVSGREVRARRRLQDRAQRQHLQRALLRGAAISPAISRARAARAASPATSRALRCPR